MVDPAYRETQKAIERVFEKQIFFVVGVMKSGTTWVQFLLDAHPEICCKGEAHFIDILTPKMNTVFSTYNGRSLIRRDLFVEAGIEGNCAFYTVEEARYIIIAAMGLMFARWAGDADVKCVGDKTPEHISALTALEKAIPSAKYIHIIRDGRDAAVSAWRIDIHRDHEDRLKEFHSFESFLEDFAENWNQDVKEAREFGAAHPKNYFELRYEDLHRESEPIVRSMFEFLGVDVSDAAVNECIETASFERVTGGRKRGQEQPGAHMRKGIVGDWRNHFDKASKAIFHEHAGTLLKELGYDD